MMEQYLPLGSVVLLNGGDKRVMIFGRRQRAISDGKMWDYMGCLYPEGSIVERHYYLFNNDQIERVFFIGFQDEEEWLFQHSLRETATEQEPVVRSAQSPV
jgi:hypothetical protein